MILPRQWNQQIRQIIQTHERIAIVGVGNELRGDDAVGVQIVRNLQQVLPSGDTVLLCEAGSAPENFTGVLRRYKPDLILIVDAVQMDADTSPGRVCLMEMTELADNFASTHSLSLNAFSKYLQNDLYCSVLLLGIQPADLTLNAPLSPFVALSQQDITQTLVNSLWERCHG